MNALRLRIALLALLMALMTALVCAWSGSRAVKAATIEQRRQEAEEECLEVRWIVERAQLDLVHEVRDYAQWTELYEQAPRPTAAWAAENLRPGLTPGGKLRVMALVSDGQVVSRHHADHHSVDQSDASDPAPAAAVAALTHQPQRSGIALFAGRPALFAVEPILRNDGSGPPHGHLIGLCYFDGFLAERIDQVGWEVALVPVPPEAAEPPPPVPGAVLMLPAVDGRLAAVLTSQGGESAIAIGATRAIVLAGLAIAAVAAVIGIVLGLRWVRPLSRLAEAVRRRAADPMQPLPDGRGLAEAEVLAEAFAALDVAERSHRDELAAALERETTASAVQQRFLAQLGHEFGRPVRTLLAVVDRLDAEGGRLPPEELAHARQAALALEERFQEVLGLAAERGETPGGSERELADYLAGVAELLAPTAARRGLALRVEAAPGRAVLDGRLLTPVLVNLAANAIRATASGAVTLSAQHDADGTRWTVADTGPGIAPDLAARIADACQRGEVLPGTPGIGLGLALALANARALRGRLELARNGADGAAFVLTLPSQQPGHGTGLHRRPVSALR